VEETKEMDHKPGIKSNARETGKSSQM
jgi:hypothetical protein